MKTEEEFEEYKRQLYKQQVKQARKTATVFGILAIVALISLVYAFFQQTAANLKWHKAEVELFVVKKEIEGLRFQVANGTRVADANAEDAKKQLQRAEEALKQLENCKKSSKRK